MPKRDSQKITPETGKKKSQAAPKKPRSRRRRIGVWLAKAFGWLVAMAIVGVLLLSVIVFIAYKNRVYLVNNALGRLTESYRIEVEEFELYEWNRIVVNGLYMTPIDAPEDARPTRVEQVEITYDLDELRTSRKVREITMVKPQIQVDDRALKALGIGEKSEPEEADADINLSFLGKFADSFEVKEGEFDLNISSAPPVSLEWNFKTTALDMSDSAKWMTNTPMEMRLENVEIGGNDGELGTIEEVLIDLNLSPDFQRISVEEFGLESPSLLVSPKWFPKTATTGGKTEPANEQGRFAEPTLLDREEVGEVIEETPKPLASNDSFFMLKKVFLRNGDFSIREFPGIPDSAFKSDFEFEGFRWGDGMFDAGSPMNFTLDEVSFGELATAESIDFRANWVDFLTLNWVESIVIHEPDFLVTKETLAPFSHGREEGENEKENDSEPAKSEPGRPFLVRKLEVWDGRAKVGLWESGAEISGGVNLNLEALEFGGEAGFRSDGDQILWIDEFSMKGPEADALPLISFPAGRAQFQFEALLKQKDIESLAIYRPRIDIQDELLKPWKDDSGSETPEASESVSDSGEGDEGFWKVGDLRLVEGFLNVDTVMAKNVVPKMTGEFSLLSEPSLSKEPEVNPGYRLVFSDVKVRNRESELETGEVIRERDVVTVRALTMEATARGLQKEQRIQKIDVQGGVLKVGKALNSLANTGGAKEGGEDEDVPEADPQEPPAPQAAADENTESGEGAWSIGEFSVSQSRVRFEGLADEIEGLEFQVKTTMHEVPLNESGLLKSDEINKLELSELEIRDPYDGFGKVLELPTVFVEFSLADLMKQRIHRIDILGPRLYVGEGLFRWNEYRKKYMEQNEGTTLDIEDEGGVAAVAEEEGWKLGEVKASYGQIVIAPKGYPVGFVPFPFEASSNFETGDLAFNLKIPEENYVYDFPQYKVKLFGLSGEVEFNKSNEENPNPEGEEVNNFVQTFEVDRAVWKQFEAETMSLSVTLDEEVVHGDFYAKIYDGDINGQFNYYLKENEKWDAWVSGVNLDTEPLTAVLTPENFDMKGRITGKIVSQGVGLEFGETTGDFVTLEPGRFDVTKLKKIIEELPPEWTHLQRSLTKLGLETVKEFSYDEGKGQLFFLNRDGWLELSLEGEYGLRALKVNVHDWRGKDEAQPPFPEPVIAEENGGVGE